MLLNINCDWNCRTYVDFQVSQTGLGVIIAVLQMIKWKFIDIPVTFQVTVLIYLH